MSQNSKPYAYLCGVPKEQCNGVNTHLNHGMPPGMKAHPSPTEAFNCHRRLPISQGYKQVGGREFAPPDGGPVQVLTKKSKFGAKMRSGKEGTRNMPHGHKGKGVILSL